MIFKLQPTQIYAKLPTTTFVKFCNTVQEAFNPFPLTQIPYASLKDEHWFAVQVSDTRMLK